MLVTFTNPVLLIHDKAPLAVEHPEDTASIPDNVRHVLAVHPRMPAQSKPMLARTAAALE